MGVRGGRTARLLFFLGADQNKRTVAFPPFFPPQVIGVGGGGSNAVNRMLASDLRGVDLYVINTDAQVREERREKEGG